MSARRHPPRERPHARRPESPVWLLIAALCLAIPACTTYPATIHPEFDSLRPEVVRVAPVENKTLISNLDRYPTSGLLQSFIDRGEINVLAEMAEAAETQLRSRGYVVAFEGGPPPDGELRLRVRRWRGEDRFERRGIEAELEAELVALDEGVTIFERRYRARVAGGPRAGGPMTRFDLARGAASSVRALLSPLPRARRE